MSTRSSHLARTATAAALLIAAPLCMAQATVPWTSPAWTDFGTTNIIGVEGNFMPGWTTLTGTPDIGNNVFFVPTTSLSGAADDAALWMLQFDPTHHAFVSNESAELSLSGFTPGMQYELAFFATIVYSSPSGWNAQHDALNIDLVGADISTFTTSVLSDVGDVDGINTWTPQSLVFTAMNPVVNFRFNEWPSAIDPDLVARFGIDGLRMRLVPSPGGAGVLVVAAFATGLRRRR